MVVLNEMVVLLKESPATVDHLQHPFCAWDGGSQQTMSGLWNQLKIIASSSACPIVTGKLSEGSILLQPYEKRWLSHFGSKC